MSVRFCTKLVGILPENEANFKSIAQRADRTKLVKEFFYFSIIFIS